MKEKRPFIPLTSIVPPWSPLPLFFLRLFLILLSKRINIHFGTPPSAMHTLPFTSQLSSVTQSCLTVCDPINHSTPGLPVHHQLLGSTHTHVHRVNAAIQPSHPPSSSSPSALNLSQHQGLFQWVSSLHQVAKLLEFKLQHQSFQWIPRTDLL